MDREKRVDESWKDSAAKEKEQLNVKEEKAPAQEAKQKIEEKETEKAAHDCSSHKGHSCSEGAVEVDFLNYVASMGFQSMIFLGEVAHPVTSQIEKNLDQAKFIIDTLSMLREKTKGNLNEQEENMLNATLYELQLKYVEIVEKEAPAKETK